MGRKVRVFFWLLTAFCFGYDFYLWGGLERTPLVGRELMKEAPFQSPLAATYMFLGQKVNGTLGREDQARAFAAARFPELVAHPEQLQFIGVRRFLDAQSLAGSLAYYGAPLLLVLSLVLHVRRQKPIRSLGGTS
jgi:hypothetical protein